MVLCRVIMGNMELIHPGSEQFYPSSENFDSGIDDFQNPSYYVVWNMNVNTHIYPECVISFRVPPSAKGDSFSHIFNMFHNGICFLKLKLFLKFKKLYHIGLQMTYQLIFYCWKSMFFKS
uniref:PARP catalytic domain-containing protein n=1 Tax=Nelumbo nucifera TaxID=4432 RepID=A0A822YWM7_NELNU|nr:TPA_asm: hypothetical protein HUJ06_007214 [Nelumbo nucifera]